MKKLILTCALVLGISSAASAGTVIDQLVWEASPKQQQQLELELVLPKVKSYAPEWYTYDPRTRLCFANSGNKPYSMRNLTVVPCTDLVIKQIIEDYSK